MGFAWVLPELRIGLMFLQEVGSIKICQCGQVSQCTFLFTKKDLNVADCLFY